MKKEKLNTAVEGVIVDSAVTRTIDQINDLNINNELNEAAEAIAEANNQTLEDLYNGIQSELNSNNPVIKERGLKAAAAFTSQLTKLVLRQTLDIIDLGTKENKIISKFSEFEMGEGNTYQFILNLDTGVDSYRDKPFVPEDHTDPQIEVKNCNWKKDNGDLGDWSFTFHKPRTIRQHEWLPYFKANTLSQFVSEIRNEMNESISLMKRAKIQKFIKQLPITKTITGKASNVDCYDSYIELLDTIETIQFDTEEFCINSTGNNPSKNIKAAKKSDILLLIHKSTYNLLKTAVKARATNPTYISLSDSMDLDNVVTFYRMIDDSADSKTVITTKNESIVAPNEIIVIDKKALVLINRLFFYGEQQYNKNMALELDLHYWFMLDYLPWRKAFKFTDNKLTVVPQ